MVPKPIRDQIWATYRPGQCDDWNPNREYLLAARNAVVAVAKKEGIEPDTTLYDTFLSSGNLVRAIKKMVDGTPWQAHQKKWLGCERCGLCEGRNRVVLARGQLPCDVLFIGEAPGASENIIGQPFVGPAGKLLDRIIENVMRPKSSRSGITMPHARMAFTNLVGCFPKEAKDAGTNEPPEDAIRACRLRLEEIVRMARPRLVVAVGGLAKKWVQTWRVGLGLGDVKLVDIVHPAAILRAHPTAQGLMAQRAALTIQEAIEEVFQ